MDPNACIERTADAIRRGDLDEAAAAAGDLVEWLDRGGFPPSNWTDLIHAIAGPRMPEDGSELDDE